MIRKGSSIFSFIYTVASILLSSSSILNCNGYKMLGIFPTPSYSHQQSLLALSKALAARGHEVTILTTDPIKDLQKWMDEAKDGVIYFSLGGNMKGTSVPERIRAELIKAFKMFPKIRVLWKWEADTDLPGRPENVLVRKWFPQQSVFAHPKTKVFISHGGQQSFQEAIHYNIPVLAISIFGDQDFNSRMLLRSGSGLRIELKDITCKAVYEKLKSLICDPSYKINMQRLNSIMQDKPMPSMDTAIWWIEYVIRHNGAPHLRPAVLDFSWYQYLMLDILSVIILFVTLVTYLVYCVIKFTWSLPFSTFKIVKSKND